MADPLCPRRDAECAMRGREVLTKRRYRVDQRRDHHGPRFLIEAASSRATAVRGQWLVAWRIQNLGQGSIEVLSTWLPHDAFSSNQRTTNPPLRLLPRESTLLELHVACHEPPGSVVDNAFMILRVLWRAHPWRVFVRHRVVVDDTGAPQHVCQAVSVQPVGFSASGKAGPSQPV